MSFLHPTHRHLSHSIRERRLCMKGGPRATVDVLKDADSTDLQLEQLLQRQDELKALRESIGDFDDAERQVINANLRRLERLTKTTEDQKEMLAELRGDIEKGEAGPEGDEGPKGEEGEEGPESAPGSKAEKDEKKTNAFTEWTDRQVAAISKWSPTKKAVVATATLGAVGLWLYLTTRKKRVTRSTPDGGTETVVEEKGFVRGLLPWIPVIGLLGLAGYGGYRAVMSKYGSLKRAQDALAKKASDLELKDKPWKKYGLEKAQYDKARDLCKRKGVDQVGDEVKEIFGLAPGETSDEYEKFMEGMKKEFDVQKIEGITYARAEVAFNNYESNVGLALSGLGEWIENHWLEVGLGTLLAARLGALRLILKAGQTTAKTSLNLARTMLRWGIKHPLISAIFVGGSILASRETFDSDSDVYLPENMEDLVAACHSDTAHLSIGDVEIAAEDVAGIKEHAKEASDLVTEDAGTWVETGVKSFTASMMTTIPEITALTEEEVSIGRHVACFDAIRARLENKKTWAETDEDAKQALMPGKYEKALAQLETYQIALVNERLLEGEEPRDDALVEAEFEKLKKALSEVKVTLRIEDGIVRWRIDGEDEELDLCVDCSIKDRDKMHTLSKTLHHGESDASYFFGQAVQELRMELEEGSERVKGLTSNKGIAMVVGNMVYFSSLDNWGKYFMVPVHVVKDMPFWSNQNGREWSATVATGAVTTGIMSLSMSVLRSIQNFAIGGGPLVYRSRPARLIRSITPIWGQIDMHKHVVRTKDALRVIKELGTKGRRANNLIGKAQIELKWIFNMKSNDPKVLKHILGKLKYKDTLGKGVPALQAEIKRIMLERMRAVKLGIINPKQAADAEEILDLLSNRPSRTMSSRLSSLTEGLSRGASVDELRYFGASADDLLNAGYTLEQLRLANIPADEIMSYGNSVDDLLRAGWTPEQLARAGGSVDDLIAAGSGIDDLARWSPNVDELLKAGANLDDIVRANVASMDDYARAGVKMAQYVNAGGNGDDFIRILMANGNTADDLAKLGVTADDILRLANGVPEELLNLCGSGDEAAAVLRAAGRQGTQFADDVARLAARNARWATAGKILKYGGGAAFGVGATGLEGYMFYKHDKPRLLERIKNSKDPMEIKRCKQEILVREGGLAMSAVMLPAMFTGPGMLYFIGKAGVDITNESIYKGVDYHLQTEASMSERPPGAMLWEVSKTAPGDGISLGHAFATVGEWDSVENGNESVRRDAYRAYFNRLAVYNLPPVTEEYLPDNVLASGNDDYKTVMMKELIRDRNGVFAGHAARYIDHITRGTFVTVDSGIMRRAEAFARIKTAEYMKGRLDENYEPTSAKLGSTEMDTMLEENIDQLHDAYATQAVALFEKGDKKSAAAIILSLAKHHLASCEQRILSTDYHNITHWKGWWHNVSDYDLQCIARAVYAERAEYVIRDIMEGGSLTKEQVLNASWEIGERLKEDDPNDIALEAASGKWKKFYRHWGGDQDGAMNPSQRLTPEGILQMRLR